MSRTDSRRLTETKMQLWLENGSPLGWLVDPIEATGSVYRPDAKTLVHQRPASMVAEAPVSGFVLHCSRF